MAGMPPMGGAPGGAPTQFGPESLMALLMSMMMGGPQQMGQAAGSGTAVGQNSLQSILPQLMQAQQPPMQGGQPPGGQMGRPPTAPGQGPGGPGMQQPPTQIMQFIQMLQQLGMTRGGSGTNPYGGGGATGHGPV